jgi:hypothetical protein
VEVAAMRVVLLVLSLVFLAGACAGGADVEAVEVTGSTGQCTETNTRWSGERPAGSGLPGTVLERTVVCPDRVMSDERLSGRTEGSFRCEFEMKGSAAVGTCVKSMTTTNDGGTWVETAGSLVLTVTGGTLSDAVDEGVQVGTGDYGGLQFRYETGGTSYPWEIAGVLEPVD